MTHNDFRRSAIRGIAAALRTVAAILVLALAVPSQAGVDTILARGFNPNIAYHVNEFDSINTLTGELMLDVPLGPTYKTNGTLQYSFGLHYTPDFWSYIDYNGINTPSPHYETRLVDFDGVGWRAYTLFVIGVDQPSGDTYLGSEAVPVGNAGAGWFVAVERFAADPSTEAYRGGTYTDNHGAAHIFAPGMHGTGPNCSSVNDPQCAGPMYTHDGSYLRMRVVDANPLIREVDLPDGTVKHFECVDRCTTTASQWNLKWTADPFGNVLLIERTPEAKPHSGTWVWDYIEGTIPNGETRPNPYYRASDRGNVHSIRQHRLTFQIDRYSDLLPSTGERLLKAELAGPGGDRTVVFTMGYGADMDMFRTTVRPWTGAGLLYPFNADKTISVKVLRTVTLPEPAGVWQFDYNRGDEDPAHAPIYTYCSDVSAPSDNCPVNARYPTSKIVGRVNKARSPAGGGYTYKYGGRSVTTRSCVPGGTRNTGGGTFTGVRERQQLDENGTAIAANIWRYSGNGYFRSFRDENGPDADGDGLPDGDTWDDGDTNHNGHWDLGEPLLCRAPIEFVSSMLEPNGKLTLSYYDIEFGSDWFGAPFSPELFHSDRMIRRDNSNVRRFVSSRIYQADVTTNSPFATDLGDAVRRLFREYRDADDTATSATLLRSSFATYESSAVECDPGVPGGDCKQYNLRLASDHVRFHDDPATTSFLAPDGSVVTEKPYIETLNSDFDGLGHYRQRNILGNFRAASQGHPALSDWDHRIEYRLFNPSASWSPNQRNATGIPATGEPWLISLFTHTSDLEASRAITTRYHFDSKRGYLRAKRKIKQSTNTGGLPMPPNSARALLAQEGADDFLAVFTRRNDGDEDVILREEDYGGDGGHLGGWQIVDDQAVIASGAERDYAIDTTFRYGAEAKSEYLSCNNDALYVQSSAAELEPGMGLPASVTDVSGLKTRYTYDLLGRVKDVTPPGGVTAQTYTYTSRTAGSSNLIGIDRPGGSSMSYDFDGQGRLKHATHVMPAGSSTTTYGYTSTGQIASQMLPAGGSIVHEYDVFDRETKLTNADNKFSETVYHGERESVRTTHGVALNSGDKAHLTQDFDIYGRLTEVSDDVSHVDYQYDPQFNLTKVTLNAAGSDVRQVRLLDYDGRGVMKSATHPELRQAPPGDGQVVVKYKFDARGHATDTDYSWFDGGNRPSLAQWSLSSSYDKAERLHTVWNRTQPLQEFHYNSNDDALGKRNRLESDTRHNYVADPSSTDGTRTIDVTTSYVYKNCAAETACTGQLESAALAASVPPINNHGRDTFFGATTNFGYDPRGELNRIDYPTAGIADAAARRINFTYDHGYLTSVTEGTGAGVNRAAITYALNGQPNVVQLSAANATDTFTPDTSGLPRPKSINWQWAGNHNDTGQFAYDGAGNISGIGGMNGVGGDAFKYDQGQRLVWARIADQEETYDYDGFGNRTKFNGADTGVDWRSNRLASFHYDDLGNVTQMPDPRTFNTPPASPKLNFVFDPLNMMIKADGEGIGKVFVYDANNERVGVIDYKATGGARELWSIRDQAHRVLRDFERTFSSSGLSVWHWKKDYVYRGNVLSNTIGPGGVRDIHVDHLGSVRYVTDANGQLLPGSSTSGGRYTAFGALVFNRNLDERMAFTGHERDDDGTSDDAVDIDYMHARYYTSAKGRFLSVDPSSKAASSGNPQAWNRYTYALDNPVQFVDPDGREVIMYGSMDGNRYQPALAQMRTTETGKLMFDTIHAAQNFTLTIQGDRPLTIYNVVSDIARVTHRPDGADMFIHDSNPRGEMTKQLANGQKYDYLSNHVNKEYQKLAIFAHEFAHAYARFAIPELYAQQEAMKQVKPGGGALFDFAYKIMLSYVNLKTEEFADEFARKVLDEYAPGKWQK